MRPNPRAIVGGCRGAPLPSTYHGAETLGLQGWQARTKDVRDPPPEGRQGHGNYEEHQASHDQGRAPAGAREGVRAVYDSERWESWLRSLSKFYDYSLGNTILIAMQMPTATHVASFRSWKRDFNRYVRKGERGIEILVPMLVKERDEDDADGERRRLVGFRVGHVFDVSQTDGEPLAPRPPRLTLPPRPRTRGRCSSASRARPPSRPRCARACCTRAPWTCRRRTG